MQGKITITCDETGTHLHNTILDMSRADAIFLVHALGKMLGLEPLDYKVLTIAESMDVLGEDSDTKMAVTIDVTEFMKQLMEEDNEG